MVSIVIVVQKEEDGDANDSHKLYFFKKIDENDLMMYIMSK